MSRPAPVAATERIQALDVLRGFAVLGILVMNIQSFSMLSAAYFNPNASGYFEGADRLIWIAVQIFADMKFMTLFSVLFGAGIVLMSQKAERAGVSPAWLHYRRTFWLLVLGAAHAYLLWFGDVLVWYSLCAVIVFWFRNVRPRRLLILGLAVVAVGSALGIWTGYAVPHLPPETKAQFMNDWVPDEETITTEFQTYTGSWRGQLSHRVPMAIVMHTVVFLFFSLWRAGGLMLVGMALFKWGVLSAERSRGFYRRAVLFGVVGIAIVAYGVHANFAAGWSFEYSRFFGIQYNYWGSLLVSTGYVGVIMLWCLSPTGPKLKASLAAVGRMAFTNYIMQTLMCTWIFYGHGLGWFMGADRLQQLLVVLSVWLLQLVVSPLWLRRFRFGPLEWLWRSLTYLKVQPIVVGRDRVHGAGLG